VLGTSFGEPEIYIYESYEESDESYRQRQEKYVADFAKYKEFRKQDLEAKLARLEGEEA